MTMNLSKELGGYFELELGQKKNVISPNVEALNCARNAIRYIIQAFNIKEIYVPFYTCNVVWQAINKEGCKMVFYHIDNSFMPEIEFEENSYILYTNYFGICSKNVKKLSKKYKNLIVDNAQAFYMPEYGIASFNSLRKFFGVPDGSFLYCDRKLNKEFERDTSYQRFSHLLKRIDVSASFGYSDFCINDASLEDEPVKQMSNLTRSIFETIDLDYAKKKRLENFNFFHNKLRNKNELDITLESDDVPMVYPYYCRNNFNLRKKLIDNKIYVAQYWRSIAKEQAEYSLQENILPLPIDQRYDRKDIQKVIEVLDV